MLATASTWLATQGVSLALGFLATVIKDWWSTYQANQAQQQLGAATVAAKVNATTAETTDAMANVQRPTDAAVEKSLAAGTF